MIGLQLSYKLVRSNDVSWRLLIGSLGVVVSKTMFPNAESSSSTQAKELPATRAPWVPKFRVKSGRDHPAPTIVVEEEKQPEPPAHQGEHFRTLLNMNSDINVSRPTTSNSSSPGFCYH